MWVFTGSVGDLLDLTYLLLLTLHLTTTEFAHKVPFPTPQILSSVVIVLAPEKSNKADEREEIKQHGQVGNG